MNSDWNKDRMKELEKRKQEWEENTLRPSLEKTPERKNVFRSRMWTERKRVYTPLDVKDLDYVRDLEFPGEYPYTRGVQPTMYRGKIWTMRTQTGTGSAEETRELIKGLQRAGDFGLSLDFDLPTMLGLDPNHTLAEGEVGRTGLSVSCLKDFEPLFDGIPMDQITTSMTINFPAPIIYAMYLLTAQKQGARWDRISGTIQFDLLKEYISLKSYVFPPRPSLRWWTDLVAFATKNTPRWNVTSFWSPGSVLPGERIGGYIIATMTYVDAALKAGLNIDEFAPRISFTGPGSSMDFFESIAIHRALRRLYAKTMKEKYGAKNPNSWKFRCYSPSSPQEVYRKEPLNNIVRSAIMTLASVLGGANAVDMPAWDEPFRIPSEEASRLKLRTQQIIAYETGVTDVIDPLGGSYYVEALTNQFEEDAKKYIQTVEDKGGYVTCIENGFFQRRMAADQYKLQQEFDSGERIAVGVNAFTMGEEEMPMALHQFDHEVEQRQIERLMKIKAERNNSQVPGILQKIRNVAASEENLMPYIMEAVKADVTMGEIMQALKDVWGEYEEKSIF